MIESHYKLKRIDKKDFYKFEGISNMCFSFDDGYLDALAFFDNNKLVVLTGINVNSKYL